MPQRGLALSGLELVQWLPSIRHAARQQPPGRFHEGVPDGPLELWELGRENQSLETGIGFVPAPPNVTPGLINVHQVAQLRLKLGKVPFRPGIRQLSQTERRSSRQLVNKKLARDTRRHIGEIPAGA